MLNKKPSSYFFNSKWKKWCFKIRSRIEKPLV